MKLSTLLLTLLVAAPALAQTPVDGGLVDGGAVAVVAVDGGPVLTVEQQMLRMEGLELTPEEQRLTSAEEEESEEIEAMRQAETALVDPRAAEAVALLTAIRSLPPGTHLSDRARAALDESYAWQALTGEPPDEGIAEPIAFDIEKAKLAYDIPVEMRPEVAQWIHFFQTGGRKWFRHWLARSTRYMPLMRDILRQEGLPEDTVYLAMIESGFSTLAMSWAKASGPWQFIEPTGKRFGLDVDFFVDERRDPVKSTRAAARYLRELHGQLAGQWYLAWAGYNAGGGKLTKAVKQFETTDFWEICGKGRFLKPETKNYVPKLIAAALVTKHPEAFGFTRDEVRWQAPLETEEVTVVDPTDLNVIASAAEADLETIRLLNPELRRWLTPPSTKERPYVLRVPKGQAAVFAVNYPKVAPKERFAFRIHRVSRGDTLSRIASKYRSFPDEIVRMNNLLSTKKLKVGLELLVPIASEGAWATAEKETSGKGRRRSHVVEDEVPAGTAAPATVAHLRREVVDGKERLLYPVEAGDSLWSIGQKFGVGVEQLKGWNDLEGKRPKLRIGQALVIHPVGDKAKAIAAQAPAHEEAAKPKSAAVEPKPATASAPAAPKPAAAKGAKAGGVKSHTIERGDTLWSLSQKYGVSVDDLKKWNGLGRKSKLQVGAALKVHPSGGT